MRLLITAFVVWEVTNFFLSSEVFKLQKFLLIVDLNSQEIFPQLNLQFVQPGKTGLDLETNFEIFGFSQTLFLLIVEPAVINNCPSLDSLFPEKNFNITVNQFIKKQRKRLKKVTQEKNPLAINGYFCLRQVLFLCYK